MNAEKIDTVIVRYNNGPLFEIQKNYDNNDSIDKPIVLCTYESEIRKDKNSVYMKGSPSVISQNYVRGRVVAISCHMECGEDITKKHFRNMIR